MRKAVFCSLLLLCSVLVPNAFAGLKAGTIKDGKVDSEFVAKAATTAANLEGFLNAVYESPRFVTARVVDNQQKATGEELSFFKADARDIASRKDLETYLDYEIFNSYCKSQKGKAYRLSADRYIWTCEIDNKVVITMSYYVDWKFFGGEEAHIRYWVDSYATHLIKELLNVTVSDDTMVAASKEITATIYLQKEVSNGIPHFTCGWIGIINQSKKPFQVDPRSARITMGGAEYKVMLKGESVTANPGETYTIKASVSGLSFKPEDVQELELSISGVTFKNFTFHPSRPNPSDYDRMKIALP